MTDPEEPTPPPIRVRDIIDPKVTIVRIRPRWPDIIVCALGLALMAGFGWAFIDAL